MILMEPDRVNLHFYDSLRHLVCAKLELLVDDVCPLPPIEGNGQRWSQLQYFQHQAMGDNKDCTDVLDITGEAPPEQLPDQSDEDFQQALREYELEWQANKKKVEAEYRDCLEQGRQMGEFNGGIHLLGLALVTGKIVEVFNYDDVTREYKSQERYAPDGNDGNVLPIFFLPEEKCAHFNVAVPLETLAKYTTPPGVPAKNSMTHDSKGEKRVMPLTKAEKLKLAK